MLLPVRSPPSDAQPSFVFCSPVSGCLRLLRSVTAVGGCWGFSESRLKVARTKALLSWAGKEAYQTASGQSSAACRPVLEVKTHFASPLLSACFAEGFESNSPSPPVAGNPRRCSSAAGRRVSAAALFLCLSCSLSPCSMRRCCLNS